MSGIIVFSDLDGTLLDHETYSYAAAGPALELLRAKGIPLVLATSKTAAEVAPLRRALGFEHCPAIVENGAGVLPANAQNADGTDHDKLRAILNGLPPKLRNGFEGFSDWGPEGIASHTGLPPEDARRAGQRQFSEPGLWTGAPGNEAAFIEALAAKGVAARRGGRFLTLSFGATKASRMAQIRNAMAPGGTTIALGDAPNDAEMIAAADFGVVVKNPGAPSFDEALKNAAGTILRTDLAGPSGWNLAVMQLVSHIEASYNGASA